MNRSRIEFAGIDGNAAAPRGLPRLLADVTIGRSLSLVEHRSRFPAPPKPGKPRAALIAMVAEAGLVGRGGAAFPTARKMSAVVANAGRPVVVVNGSEGEPASAKDKLLMMWAPHLVLDGAGWAAAAVGASSAIICVKRGAAGAVAALEKAVDERRAAGEKAAFRIAEVPNRFVTGEESALVSWLNGGDAKPTLVPPRPSDRGVDRRPTLVDNVETIAHLAQIVRWGSQWFAELGTAEQRGTALVTVSGAINRSVVSEVILGSSLADVVKAAGGDVAASGGVLVGGYFGTWISAGDARVATLDNAGLRRFGGAFGCGAIAVLPHDACGLRETARVLTWMAGESAGQCGPCVNGLASVADTTSRVYLGRSEGDAVARLLRWADQIEGRGACRFPDGSVRFLRSALSVFADDVRGHAQGRACRGSTGKPVLPIPPTELARR